MVSFHMSLLLSIQITAHDITCECMNRHFESQTEADLCQSSFDQFPLCYKQDKVKVYHGSGPTHRRAAGA